MKIQIPCMECLRERLIKERVPPGKALAIDDMSEFIYNNVEINDAGLYEVECINGHKTIIPMQNEKFEILFDIGLNALRNGYKIEAIACVHASMERFREWCIKIFLKYNGIKKEDFKETWRYVGSQSERQLGAFYFLYLQTLKSRPERFEKIEFRNQVFHKGKIPTHSEAYEYIEYVLNYIHTILRQFKSQFKDSISEVEADRLQEIKKEFRGTIGVPSSLGRLVTNCDEDMSLEAAISKLKWII